MVKFDVNHSRCKFTFKHADVCNTKFNKRFGSSVVQVSWSKNDHISVKKLSFILCLMWSPPYKETSFQPPSMVCISVIIHFTLYKLQILN